MTVVIAVSVLSLLMSVAFLCYSCLIGIELLRDWWREKKEKKEASAEHARMMARSARYE